MEDLVNRLGWKWASVILFTSGSLIILFVVLTFNGGMNPGAADRKSSIILSPSARGLQKNNSNLNLWQTYKNTMFQISYPKEFTLGESLSPEANNATFSSPDKSTSIGAEAYRSGVSFEGILQIFNLMGYKQNSIKIAGKDAYLFSGSSKKNGQSLQEKAIVMQVGTAVYKIQLSYISPAVNSDTEVLFNKMASSFILL